MRFEGKSRLGFFPLPFSEAQQIRRFLWFPDAPSSAIDPCVGDGVAFEVITSGAEVLRYGIELDAYRAEQARQRIPNIVQGSTLEVQCAVECFGLLYLNPPYDWALGPADSRRTEQSFLRHTYRWLKPGGVLIFVIPGDRLAECSQIFSSHFRDVRVYRFEAPECACYNRWWSSEHDEADGRKIALRTAISPGDAFTTPVWPGIPHNSRSCLLSPKRGTTCLRADRYN